NLPTRATAPGHVADRLSRDGRTTLNRLPSARPGAPGAPGAQASGAISTGGLTRCSSVGIGDQDPIEARVSKLLQDDPGAAGDTGERIVSDVDGHLGRLRHAPIQADQQGPSAGEDDALVHDVGDQLRRRLLDRLLDRVDDLLDGRLDGFANLLLAYFNAARQARLQIATAHR